MEIERGDWIINATMAFTCGNCGMSRPLPYGIEATCGCGAILKWCIPTKEEWDRLTGGEAGPFIGT